MTGEAKRDFDKKLESTSWKAGQSIFLERSEQTRTASKFPTPGKGTD